MKNKPNLSFWQIWNMSFGFLGIQFGFALQNANVSRIFEILGGDIGKLSVYWLAAPITGLIVQPIIGHYSDKTWTRLGRRRPYFLVGAILASIALLAMPNSPTLWIAVGTLWIMDASINISMEPFRAFVGDMLPPNQRTMGFSMQSFFIGIGAVVASALPYILTNWFHVSNVATGNEIAPSLKLAFYLGGGVFFLAVLWTVLRTKEYSPEQLEEFEAAEKKLKEESATNTNAADAKKEPNYFKIGLVLILLGVAVTIPLLRIHVEKEVYIFAIGLIAFGVFEILAGIFKKLKLKTGFSEIISDLNKMPITMKQLAFVQFFSWFALFSMWIYTTSGVTSTKYDMKLDYEVFTELNQATANIKAVPEDEVWRNFSDIQKDLKHFEKRYEAGKNVTATVRTAKFYADTTVSQTLMLQPKTQQRMVTIIKEYNKGADWVGILMAVYNGFAAVMAFLLMWMAKRTKRTIVHAISLVIGGISMASFFVIQNPQMLIISELGIGLAWASILAMPYAILTGAIPANKMGVYMGIFNFFIVIPQIVAASILGFCVQYFFDDQPIYALLIGGISLLLAAVMVLFVKEND
ncbi:MAG: MFS transporter [Bacteroidales bacterium]|nr:MFS transporter [Bacteroidales bacterium]MBN2818019.1 MFS transporter [Bacteroidales bacterium]